VTESLQLFGQLFVKEPRYIPSFTIDLTPAHRSYSPNTNSQKPKPRQSLILTLFLKTQNRPLLQRSHTHPTCFLPLKIMKFEFWVHMSKLYFWVKVMRVWKWQLLWNSSNFIIMLFFGWWNSIRIFWRLWFLQFPMSVVHQFSTALHATTTHWNFWH